MPASLARQPVAQNHHLLAMLQAKQDIRIDVGALFVGNDGASTNRGQLLPAFTATRTFDGTDSRLVVAAFPADADDLAPAGFCRLGAPLDVSSLTGAAIDSVAYHVAAAGERLCLEHGDTAAADADSANAEAAIRQANTCGVAK